MDNDHYSCVNLWDQTNLLWQAYGNNGLNHLVICPATLEVQPNVWGVSRKIIESLATMS